jgi:DNA-directed RNA polymerase specialized sigma24 family protein
MREIALALEEISAGLLRLSRALLEAEHADTNVLPSLPRSNAGPAHSRAAQDEEARKQTSDDGGPEPAAHITAQSEGFVTATGAEEGSAPAASAPEPDASVSKLRSYDRVLNLYDMTDAGPEELAARAGCSPKSVAIFLSRARSVRDPRVAKGDQARNRVLPQSADALATVRERAVEIYASSLATQADIAKQLGCPKSTVTNAMSYWRKINDPRWAKGFLARNVAAREITISRNSTVAAPLPNPQPLSNPQPNGSRPAAAPANGKVLVADVSNCSIYGPKDAVTLSRPVVRVLSRLSDGGAYDIHTLAKAGPFAAPDLLREALSNAVPALERAGVELMKVGPGMFRVRPMEEAEDEASA